MQYLLQVTALMGAHSLGGARTRNSGYRGVWTPDLGRSDVFNNEFYQRLNEDIWSFRNKVSFHIIIYFLCQIISSNHFRKLNYNIAYFILKTLVIGKSGCDKVSIRNRLEISMGRIFY